VTDPSVWLSDVSPTITYGLAVIVISFFVVFWLVVRIGRIPPILKTVGFDRSWIKTPLDRVDEAVRAGRFEPAIREVRGFVEGELNSRYRISSRRHLGFWGARGDRSPGYADLVRVARRLDTAGRNARRAEAAEWPDFIMKWLGPSWSQRAREDLDHSLVELERLLPPAEANRDGP
jgi:hypothetical protein